MSHISLLSIHYYPVKGCRGIDTDAGEITSTGLRHDRHWMLTDPDGQFMSQRQWPKMALIETAIQGGSLHLHIPGYGDLSIPPSDDGDEKTVTVWSDSCLAVDDGDEAAAFFSGFLGTACRLVHMPAHEVREKKPGFGRMQFADGYPFLILSQASLDELNRRIMQNGGDPVPMDRFRPNLVIAGCDAFAEDEWKSIQIGDIQFELIKPCVRCSVPSIDQLTADKKKEPLKTLAQFRRPDGGENVIFGQNSIHLQAGRIRKGDPVTVI